MNIISIGFIQRDWRAVLAGAQHKRDCEFTNISGTSKVLRHGVFHELDGAVRRGHVLTLMEDAEQTRTWNKENWIDALGRSIDKLIMEFCEDRNGTMICIRALQGHIQDQSNVIFSLTKIPLNWKEHIFHTGSPSNYKSGGPSLGSTRQACFFSLLSPRFVIDTANDRLERTR